MLGRLGVGGMATVYLAEDSSLGRKVALKVMAERYAEDGEFVERFRREAQAAARLNHPNIIAVYDRGEADGRPYIAMEYLQGRTLKQVIQAEGPLPPERAIAIAMQVLAGLRYAHEHGVVHRDVKPHNVLVGDDGRIKVTDFGIAHAGDPQMTEVGSIVGTAQYLSPEQARGRGVGPQTDIYSLGVVLYEMLAGRVPFEGDSSVAIAMQHVSDEAPPLRALAPDVPESLALVVAHAMLKDPAQRYGSADEFAADLDRVRRGLVPVAATAALTAIVPHEPTELVPAVEATRIAPRAERHAAAERREAAACATDAAQALALAVAARPAARARRRRARGVRDRRRARRRLADDDRRARRRRTRRRPRSPTAHARRPRGQDATQEAKATLQRLSARPRRSRRRSPCATPRTRPTSSSRAIPDRVPCCTRATPCASRSRAGRRTIPNIVGETQADAQQELGTDFKFSPAVRGERHVDKGKVTRTDPAVGTTAARSARR